jgi:hypothetical protein
VKLRELIKHLTDIADDMETSLGTDVEPEVIATYQPAHPLTGTIEGVAALDEGDDGEPLLIDWQPIVWIVVGGHPEGIRPYAPSVVWEAV